MSSISQFINNLYSLLYCSYTLHILFQSEPKVTLLLALIRFHSLYHLLSFIVIRYHSLDHSLSLVVIRCHSFSFDVPLVCLFINSLIRWCSGNRLCAKLALTMSCNLNFVSHSKPHKNEDIQIKQEEAFYSKNTTNVI